MAKRIIEGHHGRIIIIAGDLKKPGDEAWVQITTIAEVTTGGEPKIKVMRFSLREFCAIANTNMMELFAAPEGGEQ